MRKVVLGKQMVELLGLGNHHLVHRIQELKLGDTEVELRKESQRADNQELLVEDNQEILVEDIQERLVEDNQERLAEDNQESPVEDNQERLVEDIRVQVDNLERQTDNQVLVDNLEIVLEQVDILDWVDNQWMEDTVGRYPK